MDNLQYRLVLCACIIVFMFACIGLMFYIRQDYLYRRQEELWHIEFKKNFLEDGKELECYKIFRQTGYLPRYCKE